MTWHKRIPFKWSFCIWRDIINKLHTDDMVISFGQPTVTRCVCCIKPQAKSVDHTFSLGHFAKAIWKKFTGPVAFPFQAMPLRLLLIKWWMQKSRHDAHKLLMDTLPIIICLNLWKNICSARYGSKQSSMIRVLFSINFDINLLLKATYPSFHWPLHWNELYSIVETMQHHIYTSQVTWHKLEDGFVKMNSDGSALSNPGKIGAGVIIRDHLGRFIHAIASPPGEGTNNMTETEAVIISMKWCLENSHFKVHLEADFALLVHWINHEYEPHWSLEMQLQKLIDLCFRCHELKCSHVYREANCPSDSLSELSYDLTQITHFENILDLPRQIKMCGINSFGILSVRNQSGDTSRYKRQVQIIDEFSKRSISISDAQSLASVPITLGLSQGFCKFVTTGKHFW
ncbi:uncharacterized protein LOC142166437 [Nicotiana tabacum]|uniref:Uncharacterized protein LOC142166437 n=1 Tax=Nicotiana tabacum TaxID=4097 RepID=A0AC58S9Z6_TOBAC